MSLGLVPTPCKLDAILRGIHVIGSLPGGGGGGREGSHTKQTGMLVGNFELDP